MRAFAFFLTAALIAQGPQEPRVRRWKADLEAFASHYASDHPAPFRRLSQTEFRERIRVLEQALPALKNHEIAARWAALIGVLGDEHTEVDFDAEFGARRLPI